MVRRHYLLIARDTFNQRSLCLLSGEYTETDENGNRIAVYPDGAAVVEYADGRTFERNPDGRWIILAADGSYTEVSPDGTRVTVGSDGKVVIA